MNRTFKWLLVVCLCFLIVGCSQVADQNDKNDAEGDLGREGLPDIDNVTLPTGESSALDDTIAQFMGQDFSNPELSDLLTVMRSTFKTAPFTLMMEDEKGMTVELYYLADETGFSTVTQSEYNNVNDEIVDVIEFHDGEYFNTVVHSMRTVERYTDSVNDKKFFDFGTRTAYVGKAVNGTLITYTFRDLGPLGLSGMPVYYDYDVDMSNNQLLAMSVYHKESDASPKEDDGKRYELNRPSYGYSNMDQIPEDYRVIDGGLVYDGEHYPFWYVPASE